MWTLVLTIWFAPLPGAEVATTEELAGYVWKSDCIRDIGPAVEGRMSRDWVTSAAGRCVRR